MKDCVISSTKAQEFKQVIDKFMDRAYKELGLTRLEGLYLTVLFEQDGVSLIELTNAIHMDKANTTRVINELENKNYVIRKTNEKDNRKFKIFITEEAKSLKSLINKKREELNDLAFNGLSKEEISVFKLTMSKILSNLSLI